MKMRFPILVLAIFAAGGGWGGGWGWGYRHASTYEEGAMRGMAAILQAQGARNLMNAQAP